MYIIKEKKRSKFKKKLKNINIFIQLWNISGYFIYFFYRILPLYILVIAFYAYMLPYMGSGPLWNSRVLQESERCQKNWWTNVLFVSNYINVEEHVCEYCSKMIT